MNYYISEYQNSKPIQKFCSYIMKQLKEEVIDEISFKNVHHIIQIQNILKCKEYSEDFWRISIPTGPFSKTDMKHLVSNFMEFYYFLKLQMILYPFKSQIHGKILFN